MLLKGKASGAVIRLREMINHVKWASAWISFVALGQGLVWHLKYLLEEWKEVTMEIYYPLNWFTLQL